MKTEAVEQHFTVSALAERLGLGARTIWRLVDSGEISPTIRPCGIGKGKPVLIPARAVARFLKAREVRSVAE